MAKLSMPSVGGGKFDPGGWAGGLFAAAFVGVFFPLIGTGWQSLVGLGTSAALIKVFKVTGWKGAALWLFLGMIATPIVGGLLGGVVTSTSAPVTQWTNQLVNLVRPVVDAVTSQVNART